MEINKVGDRWDLPVAGQLVTQLRFDYAFSILLEDGVLIRIGGSFVLITPSGQHALDPESDPEEMAPVLALARSTVVQGSAFEDGSLELSFSTGELLLVPVSEQYEAWEAAGSKGMLVVSSPGGGLAIF